MFVAFMILFMYAQYTAILLWSVVDISSLWRVMWRREYILSVHGPSFAVIVVYVFDNSSHFIGARASSQPGPLRTTSDCQRSRGVGAQRVVSLLVAYCSVFC